mgnify:FL=1
MLVIFYDLHHSLEYHVLSPEVKHFVAVSVVEHHLVNMDGCGLRRDTLLNTLQERREEDWILTQHLLGEPKVTSKQDATHIAIE